ncbi:MAG: hypothetical protein Q9212_005652 [Teloschistes hypoglaucus]
MASARCCAIQALRKAITVIRRTNLKDSDALKTRVKRDVALLIRDFQRYGLQDQVSILDLLVSFDTWPHNQNFPKDMPRILELLHQSLSRPITGSLLEQIMLLRQLIRLRYYFTTKDAYTSVDAQLEQLWVLLSLRLVKVEEELGFYQSETMEADSAILNALLKLDTQMHCNEPGEPRAGLTHGIAMLVAQLESRAVAQEQEPDDKETSIKEPLPANVEPNPTSPTRFIIPVDSSTSTPTSRNPIADLFEERRRRHQADEKKQFDDEAIASRTRARARQEALMSDPAKAEQLKHAAKVKAAKVDDQRARVNITKTIQDDRAYMKARAEQERLARKAVEEQNRLAREAAAKVPATEEESHEDDSDDEGDSDEEESSDKEQDSTEWQGRGAGRKLEE